MLNKEKKEMKLVAKRVSAQSEVDVKALAEEKAEEALAKVAEEISKTYFRTVEIGFNIRVK